jgi:hypothetical protein
MWQKECSICAFISLAYFHRIWCSVLSIFLKNSTISFFFKGE